MLQFFASPTVYQPISSLPTTATSSVRSLQTTSTRCRPTCRRTLDGWTPSGGDGEVGGSRRAAIPPSLPTDDNSARCTGNASSKRVFSQVRKIATNFRSELGRDTLFCVCPISSWKQMGSIALCSASSGT